MAATILVMLGLVGLGYFVQWLAKIIFYFTNNPENTFSFKVPADSPEGRGEDGGGNIQGIPHAVSGKYVDTSDQDRMNWRFKPETDDRKEDRGFWGFLYPILGVWAIGLYSTLRTTLDRRSHYERSGAPEKKEGDEVKGPGTFNMVHKDVKIKHLHYSGEQGVYVPNADTAGAFELDFGFTFVYERNWPVRAMLRVANSNAVLTNAAKEIVNGLTSQHQPEAYLGGPRASQFREELVLALGGGKQKSALGQSFIAAMEDALGITITQVFLHDIDMDREQRAYVELTLKAKREMEALLVRAQEEVKIAAEQARKEIELAKGRSQARKLDNEAEEDYVKRVIIPMSQHRDAVRAYRSRQVRDSKITVWAPGSRGGVFAGAGSNPAPDGDNPSPGGNPTPGGDKPGPKETRTEPRAEKKRRTGTHG